MNTNFAPLWEEEKIIKGEMYNCNSQENWNICREKYKEFLSKAKMVYNTFSTNEKYQAFRQRENDDILKIYNTVKQRWETTDGKTPPIKPPDWILEQLPKPSTSDPNMTLVLYCQNANQLLVNDSANPEYSDKIDGYKQWYVDKLYKDYIPILRTRHPNATVEKIKNAIKDAWNNNTVKFKIAD